MFTTLELGQRGRLGNQLFQVAAVIGASEKHRVPFVLPEWSVGRFMTGFPFPVLHRHEGWHDYRELFFHYAEIPAPGPVGTSLQGYFQSWRYFSNCLDRVRLLLGPSSETKARAARKLPGFCGASDTGAIHIRRGDYQEWDKGAYVNLEETKYYDRAMCEGGGSKTQWYLFSDDPLWCLQEFGSSDMRIVQPDADPYVDLVAMSLCRCNIIANSTFSWWAGMLNLHADVRVYCPEPSDWFGSWHAGHDTRDLLPSDWVRMCSR